MENKPDQLSVLSSSIYTKEFVVGQKVLIEFKAFDKFRMAMWLCIYAKQIITEAPSIFIIC